MDFLQVINTFVKESKAVQSIKTHMAPVVKGAKYAGKVIAETYDKTVEAAETIGKAKEVVTIIVNNDLEGIGGRADKSIKLSATYDEFVKDVESKWLHSTASSKASVLETFARTHFGSKVYDAGSIIKNEGPQILDGIRDLQDGIQGLHTDSGDFIDRAKQVKDSVDKVVDAVQQIDKSLNNVFTRATTQLGINATSMLSLQAQLHTLVSTVGSSVPPALKQAYANLGSGIDTLSAGKTMLTVLVSDLQGKTTPASLAKFAQDLNTTWDDFADKANNMYYQLSGGAKSNILQDLVVSNFGQSVFDVGSALKKNSPTILSGIASYKSAIEGFGGSYRDPVVASEKIRSGVNAIVQSTADMAKSINNIVKAIQSRGGTATGTGFRALKALGELPNQTQMKLGLSIINIGADGISGYNNVMGTLDSLKKGDLKGAIDKGMAAGRDVKDVVDTFKGTKSSFGTAIGNLKITSANTGSLTGAAASIDASALEEVEQVQAQEVSEDEDSDDSSNDDSYVCSGATMRCSFGTSQAKLTVYPDRTVFLTGEPMANISDHISLYNIARFGRCRTVTFPPTGAATSAHHGHLTPMPCVPGTYSEWLNGKTDVIVKGKDALLKSSYCKCCYGGIITITKDGQK